MAEEKNSDVDVKTETVEETTSENQSEEVSDNVLDSETKTINHNPFDDEPLDESLLMGVEESETKTEESNEDLSEETETDAETDEETEEESEPDEEKPPSGYVPLAALQEERGKRKELAASLDEMRQELDALKTIKTEKPDKPDDKEFRILSDREFDDLLEEDPKAAVRYQRELIKRDQDRQANEKAAKEKEDLERRDEAIVTRAFDEAQQAIPELYKDGSKLGEQLRDFAVKYGLDQNILGILANPKTRIVLPDSAESIPLGSGAVSLLKFLHNTYKASDTTELRQEMKKEATAEVMKKLKTGKQMTHTSLGDVPGSTDESQRTNKRVPTEAEMLHMSEDQMRDLLTYGSF